MFPIIYFIFVCVSRLPCSLGLSYTQVQVCQNNINLFDILYKLLTYPDKFFYHYVTLRFVMIFGQRTPHCPRCSSYSKSRFLSTRVKWVDPVFGLSIGLNTTSCHGLTMATFLSLDERDLRFLFDFTIVDGCGVVKKTTGFTFLEKDVRKYWPPIRPYICKTFRYICL